jgi:cytochrome b subunit of formate dehydrogenase
MLFGITVTRDLIIAGGVVLLVLVAFQVLQGMRKIKFKGKLHLKVHKRSAYALLVISLVHALMGLAYTGIVRF